MKVLLPIMPNAKKYGYITWNGKVEEKIKELLNNASEVNVTFDSRQIGKKNVDWKYKRISVGSKKTNNVSLTSTQYELAYDPTTNNLTIKVK